jgi:hypothetical protein
MGTKLSTSDTVQTDVVENPTKKTFAKTYLKKNRARRHKWRKTAQGHAKMTSGSWWARSAQGFYPNGARN